MEVHVSVAPETLWSVAIPGTGMELHITNSFLTMLLVMAFLLIAGSLIARRAALVPGRLQSVFEVVVDFILGMVESTAGRQMGRRIFPLIGGLFIFIIVSNYSGLLPGVGTIYLDTHHGEEQVAKVASTDGHGSADSHGAGSTEHAAAEEEHGEESEAAHHAPPPLFRSPSADLNMTLAMALIAFTTVQIAGVAAHGVVGRIKHLANPPFLFPIEVIGEFSRIISLSFRLFGNIFAGEVLVTVMVAMANAIKITLVGLLIPVVFLYLEVLFGFIQALVFSLLTLIYIVLATASHDGHGEHEHGEHLEEAGTLEDRAHGRQAVAAGGD